MDARTEIYSWRDKARLMITDAFARKDRWTTFSPINQRRWNNFKANRRGYWSFWIFIVLFFISLFAPIIANDKPLLLKYGGELYVPV